ncbi:hypothetical protein BDY21DRAFT_345216 [Lineolata rhizophorae]|uniref:Siderophore biosynthesis enzyme n=1 Tax=Lineolata rhizophorae TaxID=578093 RepID=A0A6A6NZQ6_9PEZI|nr:hypothetical protein BDY21DRAFT_345216 [Lineolata rhizophorae]
MPRLASTPLFLLAAAFPLALAKTDIAGCVSSSTVNAFAEPSLIWFLPDTGEVCELLDCGGGRAPPKTTVPGCAAYEGTATYEPTFLPGWGPGGQTGAASTAVETASSIVATASSSSPSEVTSLPGTTVVASSVDVSTLPGITVITGTSETASPSAAASSVASVGSASSFATGGNYTMPSTASGSSAFSTVTTGSSGFSEPTGSAGAAESDGETTTSGNAAPTQVAQQGILGVAVGVVAGLMAL